MRQIGVFVAQFLQSFCLLFVYDLNDLGHIEEPETFAKAIYFDDPKASNGQNIRGNNINPTVYPSLFPKLFEVRLTAQIKKTKFKYGTQNNNNQYQGFPIIFSQTSVEYIGIIEAHPGSFALLYKNQKDNTGKRITIKINRI